MVKNKNIDDDTRERARKFVEEKAEKPEKEYRSDPYSKMTKAERDARKGFPDDFPPAIVDDKTKGLSAKKERVVSKKELEASGLSLRDFLNKERGLTRRADKAEDKVEAAKKQLNLGEKVSAQDVDKAKKQLNLAKGGMAVAKAPMKANCGASVPPAQKAKK